MNKEANLLDIQNTASVIFIITIIVSIILTTDEKNKLLKQPTILSDESAKYLNLMNKIVVVLIALLFAYINYEQYKITKKKNSNTAPLKHQLEAAILNVIATLVVVYTIYETWSSNLNITDTENPII